MTSAVSASRSGETTTPSELELRRVTANIQDLLSSASDISHDRCVKVLTARAKVQPPPAGQLVNWQESHDRVPCRTAPWSV